MNEPEVQGGPAGSRRGQLRAFAAIRGVGWTLAEPRGQQGGPVGRAQLVNATADEIEHERGHHLVDAQAGA